MADGVYVGRAGPDGAANQGWLLGHFMPKGELLHSTDVEVKWGVHPEGQPRPDGWAPTSDTVGLSVLVSGEFRIAFRARDGQTVRWGRDDIVTQEDLMARVQASSTMPVVMPPVEIDGELYVDGALGGTGGIAIDAAREAGFSKFVVVLTQERAYRKAAQRGDWYLRRHFRRFPAVPEALAARPARYNAVREELWELEAQGAAYLFVPERMPVGNGERDVGSAVADGAGGAGVGGHLRRGEDRRAGQRHPRRRRRLPRDGSGACGDHRRWRLQERTNDHRVPPGGFRHRGRLRAGLRRIQRGLVQGVG